MENWSKSNNPVGLNNRVGWKNAKNADYEKVQNLLLCRLEIFFSKINNRVGPNKILQGRWKMDKNKVRRVYTFISQVKVESQLRNENTNKSLIP